MTEELKPCPFCGSADIAHNMFEDDAGREFSFIMCDGCGVNCNDVDTLPERKAIDVWNTRSSPLLIGLPVIDPSLMEVGK